MDLPITDWLREARQVKTKFGIVAFALMAIFLIIILFAPKLEITNLDAWQFLIFIAIIIIALYLFVNSVKETGKSPILNETTQVVNVESIGNPERGKDGILIDLSHYQDYWQPYEQFGSIFGLSKPKWTQIIETEERLWDLREITNEDLFTWNEIPGNDDEKLKNFLKQNYRINWIETAKIENINDVIKLYCDKNFCSIRLNDEANKAILTIDDGRTEELLAKKIANTIITKIFRNRHQLRSKELETWKGLIFGMPEGGRIITKEDCKAIVKWVRDGGNLIMLGYELGDRHHRTNLNLLAEEFGLRFNSDIVAPEKYDKTDSKPYGIEIYFKNINTTHMILKDVKKLCMRNLCTLSVEPGANIILTVGNNGISRWLNPTYKRGYPGSDPSGEKPKFELAEKAPSVPVVAEAPEGLTGKGHVLAIGTWDFFGSHNCFKKMDNYLFVRNLMIWLMSRN